MWLGIDVSQFRCYMLHYMLRDNIGYVKSQPRAVKHSGIFSFFPV